MRVRKATLCWGFLVHPVTKNSNTREQNVNRAENMNTQGTAKGSATCENCWEQALQLKTPVNGWTKDTDRFDGKDALSGTGQ
jgi:hypothetical protein